MNVNKSEMASTLRENIAELTARQQAEARAAPLSERIAAAISAFAGSMRFVVLHLIAYGIWIIAQFGLIPFVPRFDPSFVALAMVASVEAIFLSTFVLITQNRMAVASDRRADLDLHVNLLAEHELTKMADLVQRIAAKLDVAVTDPQYDEIRKDVEPTQVLAAIDAKRGEET